MQWSCGPLRKQWLFVKFDTEGLDVPDRSTEQVEVRRERQALEPSRSKQYRQPRKPNEGVPAAGTVVAWDDSQARKRSRSKQHLLNRNRRSRHGAAARTRTLKCRGRSRPLSEGTHEATIRRGIWGEVMDRGRVAPQREDPKDGIHGGNFSTLLLTVA